MILEIKKYPDPILRKKCQEVEEVTEEIRNLGRNMIETMTVNQGIGLATPQVGELKKIIAIQTEKGPQLFVNPKIIKKSREVIKEEEGCLSFPGLFLKIKRARGVEIEALNEKGEKIHFKIADLPARVLQHEIDHLEGILFIDRLSFWQRWKIKKEIKSFYLNF